MKEHEDRAAARIANLRRHHKMTQLQLASACGVPRFIIAAIETGNRSIKLGEAVDLCEALSVELGALVSTEPLVLRFEVSIDERGNPR